MKQYTPGTKAYYHANSFRESYSNLLRSLQSVFDSGQVSQFKQAMGIMKELVVHGRKLVKTPIDKDGDPNIGPNAGPIFPTDE